MEDGVPEEGAWHAGSNETVLKFLYGVMGMMGCMSHLSCQVSYEYLVL